MERFYEHVQRVISDHGGLLQKFAGDAVLVFFGLPQAHGDDAGHQWKHGRVRELKDADAHGKGRERPIGQERAQGS